MYFGATDGAHLHLLPNSRIAVFLYSGTTNYISFDKSSSKSIRKYNYFKTDHPFSDDFWMRFVAIFCAGVYEYVKPENSAKGEVVLYRSVLAKKG